MGALVFYGKLAPSLIGHLIPYALGVATLMGALSLLCSRFARPWRGAISVGFAGAALLGPYTFSVVDYAFGGAQISGLPHRELYMGAALFGLTLAFFACATFFLYRARSRPSFAIGGFAWLACFGLLLANHTILPNEYEVLHGLVSGVALVFAVHGGLEAARKVPERFQRARVTGSLALCLTAFGLSSTWVLRVSDVLAWPVFSESAGSRYLTVRFGASEDEAPEDPSTEKKLEKPKSGNTVENAARRKLRRGKPAPHIMVFSIDNLQADRVGAYGYSKNPTTPNIDRLAREGALFRRAYTHYPGTRIFMSSMLSGRRIPEMGPHYLPPQYQREALPRLLKKRNYHTLVMGVFELTAYRRFNPADYAIDTNLRRETQEEIRKSKTIPHTPLKVRFAEIDEHLAVAKDEEKPAFVWIHLLNPHRFRGSFVGSKDFPFGSSLDDKYDSTIAGTDAWLANLEDLIQKHFSGDGREVLWIIQADHGAGMTRETRRETGKTLFEDQVHVPLILKGAGIEPGVHDILVDSAVDMSATILDFAGISPPPSYDGVSLVPYLEGGATDDDFSDRLIPLREGALRGAVSENFKYIGNGNSHSLFDLSQDPLERHNLADENPSLLRQLRRRAKRELKRQEAAYKAAAKAP
jgi:arylsulfatase A-like enzyme